MMSEFLITVHQRLVNGVWRSASGIAWNKRIIAGWPRHPDARFDQV
jgi:hypothetical protein